MGTCSAQKDTSILRGRPSAAFADSGRRPPFGTLFHQDKTKIYHILERTLAIGYYRILPRYWTILEITLAIGYYKLSRHGVPKERLERM